MSFNSVNNVRDYPACAPYQKIPDAARITGLSQYYLRHGCKAGTIQHIRAGRVIYVFVPALYNPGPGGGDRPNS
ncbi:MAG: hypothetical protein LIO78_06825 [Clostridiales bacterium]|nr:hypothetical protein [Clostridiales bacterium]MCC8099760.1 hypothetical protein [Clostridiales bacterium]